LLRLEETRSRAERMEAGGLLNGMMAHDLNNSLCGIVGWSEVLEIAATSEEIAEATTAISHSADYAEALVQQFQHRAGGNHRDRSLDIAAALDRMQPMLVAASHKKPPKISVDVHADAGCHLAISEHSLRRLVLNLVTNARDACGEDGGRCDIRATRESSKVVLQVGDNGGGMDELTWRRIFQAFFTTKGTQGTGLGLHSVMEIVQGTDGTVEVWSEPGVGTRMTIRWPLAPLSETLPEVSPPPVSETGKARILLAEDHPIVREVMARGLRRAGYAVIEAQDGDEALRQVGSDTAFDVLCTDAVMPGEPVTRVIQRFGEHYPDRPIVVVSDSEATLAGCRGRCLAELVARFGPR
jgi:two-component system cell cycle sensor histidine kinase/response regulator CckA